jgi:hypothetical protein
VIFRFGTSTFCPRSLCTPSNPFLRHREGSNCRRMDCGTHLRTHGGDSQCHGRMRRALTVAVKRRCLQHISGNGLECQSTFGSSHPIIREICKLCYPELWSNHGPRTRANHTKHAFGSHPRRVFSISYPLTGFFHGANEGSNPSGDANSFNDFQAIW